MLKGDKVMMKRIIIALIAVFFVYAGEAAACSSIRISTTDGNIFYARTMEGDTTYGATISIVPAGTEYAGTLPDGKQDGLKWKVKYGFVGMNNVTLPVITDGVNEKGLVVGMLMFPGYAGYQEFKKDNAHKTIAQFEFATWALSNFSTADEVKEAVKNIMVSNCNKVGKLELHYTVHDATGKSIVIEYSGGKRHVFNNPLGVMTNSPTFDWQLTNLKNYVNLRAVNAPAVTVSEIKASGFGQGTGMLGLPGDYTPPSRFVRLVAFTQSALPVTGPDDGLDLAMTIISTCEIPKGVVRNMDVKPPEYDHVVWSAVADIKRMRYYYKTYDNKDWSYIDIMKALGNAKQVMTVPLFVKPQYNDATSTAVNYKNPDPALYMYKDRK
jgi:choloylglycine hydrolase